MGIKTYKLNSVTKNSGHIKEYYVETSTYWRAITVTATDQSKPYDGTKLVANNAYTLTGTLHNGHTITVTCTGETSTVTSGSTATKVVNTVVIKDSSNVDVTGLYNITKVNGTLTIRNALPVLTITGMGTYTYNGTERKLTCTVSPNIAGTIQYGTTSSLGSSTTYSSGVSIGSITNAASTGYAELTRYARFVPNDTANYDSSNIVGPATITINQATGTITYSPEAKSCIYKTTSQTVACTAASGATGTISYTLDSVTKGGSAVSGFSLSGTTLTVPASQGAGDYTITITATSSNTTNYTAKTSQKNFTLTIGKADQTWTLSTGKNALTSGDSTTYSISGTYLGTLSASISPTTYATLSSTTITASGDPKGAATTLSVTYSGNDNYNSRTQTQTITLYSKCVAPSQSGTVTYNGKSQTATFGTATYCSVTSGNTGTNSGYYTAVFTTTDSSKYRFPNNATTGTTSWYIGKAALTAKADNKSIIYGSSAPSYTVSYTGFVNGETSSVLTHTATASCSAYDTSTASKRGAGSYTITCSGATAANYEITHSTGTLTVGKATLTATGSSHTVTYGDAKPILSVTITGFKYTDTVDSITKPTASTTYTSSTAVASSPVAVTVSGGSAGSNYTFSYVSGAITINKAAATLPTVWSGASVEYEQGTATVTATGYTGGTIYYATSATSDGTYSSWTTTVPTRTTVGNTYVKCYIKGDANHSDSETSLPVSITIYAADDAQVTVTTTARTYNGSSQVLASVASGAAHGISHYYLGFGTNGSTAPTSWTTDGSISQTNAGTYYVWYKFTPDASHSNTKDPTFVSSVVISQKAASVSITPSADSFTYGGTAPTYTTSTNGIISGHTATVSVTGKPTSSSNAGSYTVTATITAIKDANNNDVTANYSLTASTCIITVNKAAPTYTAPTLVSGTITYNGSAQYIVNAGTSSHGIFYYKIDSGSYGTTDDYRKATTAGNHSVSWTLVGDANHTDISATSLGNKNIAKRTVTFTAPTIVASQEWNGAAQATSTGGSVSTGGTLYYYQSTSSTTPTFSTSTWTTRPTATNIGTYYLWAYAYVSDTDNNIGTNINTVTSIGTSVITKRTISLTWGTITWTWDGNEKTVATPTISNTVNGTSCAISLSNNKRTAAGTQTVTASITTGSDYYRLPSNYTATLTINKATISSIAAPTAKNPTYNGSSQQIINNGTTGYGTYSYSNHNQTNWKDGGYTVTWSFTADSNHVIDSGVTSSGEVTANISKRATTISPVPGVNSFVYGTTAPSYTYSMTNAHKSGLTVTGGVTGAPTSSSNVGSYTVTTNSATIKDSTTDITSNYNVTYGTCSVSVTKATASITLSASSATINTGATCNVSSYVTAKTPNVDLSYAITTNGTTTESTISGATVTAGAMSSANDTNQTVVVTITNPGNGNYSSTTKTFTITVQKNQYSLSFSNSTASVTYGSTLSVAATVSPSATISYTTSGTYTSISGSTLTGTKYSSTNKDTITASVGRTTTYAAKSITRQVSVTQRATTITGNTNGGVYKGSAYSASGATASNLASWDSLYSVSGSTSQTNAGSSSYTPSAAVIKNTDETVTTSNYSITYANGGVTVTKRPLTITAPSAKTLTYTGSAQALVNAGSWSNNVSGESGSTVGTFEYKLSTASSYSTSIPTATNAGTYTVNWKFTPGSNYSAASTSGNVNITIGQKEVGLSWGTISWVYDGSAHETTCTATSIASGDTCTVTLTNNSVGASVGTQTVTASSLSNSNYKLPNANTKTIIITQREALLSWGTTFWVYDGNIHATTCSVGNLVSGDSCTVTLTGNSVGKNVGTATVTASSLSNSNYKLPSSKTTTISITQRTVTLYFGTTLWIYDKQTHSTTCTAGNLVSGDSCTVTLSDNSVGPNVGSQVVTASALSNSNYTLPSASHSKTQTISIKQKTVGLDWGISSWTYDGSTHSTTCSATGVVSGDSCTVTLSDNSVGKNVGSQVVTASALSNSNYVLPSSKTRTISITQKTVGLSWGTISWTYDDATHSTSCTATELVSGDSCSVTLSDNSVGPNVGNQTVTASSLSNSNYALPSSKTKTISITQRAVTYKAKNQSKAYDGTKLTADSTIELVSGSLVSGHSATGSCTGEVGPNPGSATKTLSSVSISPSSKASNYSITRQAGTLTISKGSDDDNWDISGGGIPAVSGYTYTIGITGTPHGTRTTSISPTTYASISDLSVTVSGNPEGATATVTISYSGNTQYAASSKSKTFTLYSKCVAPSQSGTLTYNGSQQTASFGTATYCSVYSGNTGTNAGTYYATFKSTDSGKRLFYGGSDSANVSWIIQKRDTNITGNSNGGVYNGSAYSASGATASNLVTGHTLSSVSGSTSRTAVGTSYYTPSSAVIKDASNNTVTSNYSITYLSNSGSVSVTARPVTIKAADKSKNYGEANPTFTASITSGSLVSSGDLGTIGATCSATTSSEPGTYTITPTYTANSNYSVTPQNGTLTIYWKMTVTMNNYVTKFRYKIGSGAWSSDISTSPYTITNIPKTSKVTIEGRANEGSSAYTYGSYTYDGSWRANNVYGDGAMMENITDATIACTRTLNSYDVTINKGGTTTAIASGTYQIDSGSAHSVSWGTAFNVNHGSKVKVSATAAASNPDISSLSKPVVQQKDGDKSGTAATVTNNNALTVTCYYGTNQGVATGSMSVGADSSKDVINLSPGTWYFWFSKSRTDYSISSYSPAAAGTTGTTITADTTITVNGTYTTTTVSSGYQPCTLSAQQCILYLSYIYEGVQVKLEQYSYNYNTTIQVWDIFNDPVYDATYKYYTVSSYDDDTAFNITNDHTTHIYMQNRQLRTFNITVRAVYNNSVVASKVVTKSAGESISSTTYYGTSDTIGGYNYSGGSGQTINNINGNTSSYVVTTTYSTQTPRTYTITTGTGSNVQNAYISGTGSNKNYGTQYTITIGFSHTGYYGGTLQSAGLYSNAACTDLVASLSNGSNTYTMNSSYYSTLYIKAIYSAGSAESYDITAYSLTGVSASDTSGYVDSWKTLNFTLNSGYTYPVSWSLEGRHGEGTLDSGTVNSGSSISIYISASTWASANSPYLLYMTATSQSTPSSPNWSSMYSGYLSGVAVADNTWQHANQYSLRNYIVTNDPWNEGAQQYCDLDVDSDNVSYDGVTNFAHAQGFSYITDAYNVTELGDFLSQGSPYNYILLIFIGSGESYTVEIWGMK